MAGVMASNICFTASNVRYMLRLSSKIITPVTSVIANTLYRRNFVSKASTCNTQNSLKSPLPGVHMPSYMDVTANPPITKISTLANGLKVASLDIAGQFSTIGILIDAGSRIENKSNYGTSHFLHCMSYQATTTSTHDDMQRRVLMLGGTASSSASRDAIIYWASVLKNDVQSWVELLSDSVRNQVLSKENIEDMRAGIMYKAQDAFSQPEVVLQEALHEAAYGLTGLGNPVVCPEDYAHSLGRDEIVAYTKERYVPNNMVLAGSGCDHDELVALAEQYFGDMAPVELPAPLPPSKYIGGKTLIRPISQDALLGQPRPDLIHLGLAFDGVQWGDKDLYASYVLQILFGGGSSFSMGGPGKGVFSRLYKRVLTQHWVESCVAFNICYGDAGLFGMSASCLPQDARRLVNIMIHELVTVAQELCTIEEIERAKNQLRGLLLTNLESRYVTFEEIGRQVLMQGYRIEADTMVEQISKVTPEDVQRVMQRILKSSKPTIVAVGNTEGFDFGVSQNNDVGKSGATM